MIIRVLDSLITLIPIQRFECLIFPVVGLNGRSGIYITAIVTCGSIATMPSTKRNAHFVIEAIRRKRVQREAPNSEVYSYNTPCDRLAPRVDTHQQALHAVSVLLAHEQQQPSPRGVLCGTLIKQMLKSLISVTYEELEAFVLRHMPSIVCGTVYFKDSLNSNGGVHRSDLLSTFEMDNTTRINIYKLCDKLEAIIAQRLSQLELTVETTHATHAMIANLDCLKMLFSYLHKQRFFRFIRRYSCH